MWKGVTGCLGPCGGGGIAGMVVGSQWRLWAARAFRAAVMMWWACPFRRMWRSVPKSFGRWAAGRTVMWARARWWAFFPLSGACVRLSSGMCCCWSFGGAVPGRGILLRGGGWRVPWTCWAGCICLGTCCPSWWGPAAVGAGARCMGWSRAGHGAHTGGGRCRTG